MLENDRDATTVIGVGRSVVARSEMTTHPAFREFAEFAVSVPSELAATPVTIRGVWHQNAGFRERAIVLLHGFPETGAMWHRLAPVLGRTHTVVVPDLRGYGASSKPAAGEQSVVYSKREMAADVVHTLCAAQAR